MKIKEFAISRYGPLSSSVAIALEEFNLLFGRNEAGKSLTIDAMVKLLLGKGLKSFDNIDRVEESPEGYIVIEKSGGSDVKLPGGGDLREITGLEADDCRNIFITRNSDLAVHSESGYYTSISNKLTGLKTEQIREIISKLDDMGKLTPGGSFSNSKEDGKLKSRLEKAGDLLDDIETLSEKLTAAGFDEMESRVAGLEESIAENKDRLAEMEDARMRDQYEKASAALDKYKQGAEKLRLLDIYRSEKERIWAENQRRIEEKVKEEQRHREKLDKLEAEKKDKIRELEAARSDLKALKKRKDRLDETIRPELAVCRDLSQKLAGREGKMTFWIKLSWLASVLLGLSVIWIALDRTYISAAFTSVLAVIAVLSWIMRYSPVRDKSLLDERIESLRMAMSEIGIRARDIGGMLQAIRDFEEDYSAKEDRVRSLELQAEKLKGNTADLSGEVIPEIRKTVSEAKREIDGIRSESGIETLADYRSGLAEKAEAEQTVNEQKKVLESLLGAGDREDRPVYWEEEKEKLERYSEKSAGVTYSKAGADEIVEEIGKLERELEETRREMRSIGEELQEISITANELLPPEEGEKLYCSTMQDLEAVRNQLRRFVEEKETIREIVLEARGIFEEIESEEREKVSELFGAGKNVSDHFSRITGGMYSEVNFDHREEVVRVTDSRGNTLEAEALSGGAYDQLYFSIRLALGEELLKDKRGFFIMDDPFIKSDAERLQQQIELLGSIADSGWQIIFFTAKEEVREALEDQIESGRVNYIDLEKRYGSPGS